MASIDVSVLAGIKELAGDGESDFLATLVQLYLDSAPAKIQKMKESLTKGDPKTASFEAHSLKSSSASLGAMTVAKLSADLEKETKAGNSSPAVMALFQQLEKEFALALAELPQQVAALSQPVAKAA